MNPDIRREATFDFTLIYFGDTLHLAFKHKKIIGLQSWKDYTSAYTVEITFEGGETMVAEYDDPEKWKRVIALVAESFGRVKERK